MDFYVEHFDSVPEQSDTVSGLENQSEYSISPSSERTISADFDVELFESGPEQEDILDIMQECNGHIMLCEDYQSKTRFVFVVHPRSNDSKWRLRISGYMIETDIDIPSVLSKNSPAVAPFKTIKIVGPSTAWVIGGESHVVEYISNPRRTELLLSMFLCVLDRSASIFSSSVNLSE